MPLIASLKPGTILILVVLVALPVGALVFAHRRGQGAEGDRQGRVRDRAGVPAEPGGPVHAVPPRREAEIRQMVQARSKRGLAEGAGGARRRCRDGEAARGRASGRALGDDNELREEVRQLVVARNERRVAPGKKPLDVEKEVERQLRELENLGQ